LLLAILLFLTITKITSNIPHQKSDSKEDKVRQVSIFCGRLQWFNSGSCGKCCQTSICVVRTSGNMDIMIMGAVKLTIISDAEILGAGGGNARSESISSGRRIYNTN